MPGHHRRRRRQVLAFGVRVPATQALATDSTIATSRACALPSLVRPRRTSANDQKQLAMVERKIG